ncbi:hypothetical protein [Prochlorococcus marinus]|uniref:Uncharacterized protein n=1 Tax=Prochlorococcus marinus (strain MIT 9211) TaxID=93059 RepID=A9B9U2_PROM4|nr:hypothetical protein [Prochlorococcus marinus]ABX08604.1 Hypothetical protein P9211_06731 [Prochlorococcus marinus str. MIT 9211]
MNNQLTTKNLDVKIDDYLLNLIDFFEKFDSGNPYMRAAVSELQNSMPKELLNSQSDWFITWSQAGKR